MLFEEGKIRLYAWEEERLLSWRCDPFFFG